MALAARNRDIALSCYTVALAAKLAKLDASYNEDEILEAFEKAFAVPESQHMQILSLFRLALTDHNSVAFYTSQILQCCADSPRMAEILFKRFVHFAFHHNAFMEPAHIAFLTTVANQLNIPQKDFMELIDHHHLEDHCPYTLFGIERDVTYEVLQDHYRNIIEFYHPSRFETGHAVNDEWAYVAQHKYTAFTNAYHAIKVDRGF